MAKQDKKDSGSNYGNKTNKNIGDSSSNKRTGAGETKGFGSGNRPPKTKKD